jgi:flagellar hook-associated protein 2
VNLSVQSAADAPVIISVAGTDEDLVEVVDQFVEAYNSLRDSLDKLTEFDETDGASGILFGTHEALRVDTDLADLVTRRFHGLGRYASLEAVGIELDDSGKLSVNHERLQAAFADDAESLQRLFTDEERGVAAAFDKLIDQLAGEGNSLLVSRTDSLNDKIDVNTRRLEALDARLESERERLLKQFFDMEEAVARMQSDLAAIQGLQALAPLSVSLGQRDRP